MSFLNFTTQTCRLSATRPDPWIKSIHVEIGQTGLRPDKVGGLIENPSEQSPNGRSSGDGLQVPAWTGASVAYLAVDCVPVTSLPSLRHLRSAESGCLAVTGTMTTLGSRNFAVAGAKVWNSLPVDLRLLSRSLRTFGHKLKHYLFMSEP